MPEGSGVETPGSDVRAGDVGHRRRPVHTALTVFVCVLFVVVEWLVVMSYRHATETTRRVHAATDTTTTLANVQRESYLLHDLVRGLSDGPDVQEAIFRADLFERQLLVAKGQAVGGLDAGVAGIQERLDLFRGALDRLEGAPPARIAAGRQELRRFTAEFMLLSKQLFDDQEHALYGALGEDLEQGERGQLLLVGLGGSVLFLGAVLALLLRRSVRADFAKAHSVLLHEMAERAALQEQLAHEALHDPLTGLGNRLHFVREAERALARADRAASATALVYLDLDDFKPVNDTLGHAGGDELLRQVAERLRASIRTVDTAARLGGDEFAILLEGAGTTQDVLTIVERLTSGLAEPFDVRGHRVRISASVGVVPAADPGVGVDDFIRTADLAMYEAKARGKGEYVIFGDDLRQVARERHTLERDLEQAVADGQLSCAYQPIVDLDTGAIEGMEALARWRHPSGRDVPPAEFIPIAEDLGLIHAIGSHVLTTAASQMASWQERFASVRDAFVSVNVSVRQCYDAGFPDEVASALARSGLPPASLVAEITETVMMGEREKTVEVLRALRERGVRIAIDDFGTGYSSLSYLRFLPIDLLKIDRSFISTHEHDQVIVDTIARLARTLGIVAVAEGIEEPEQVTRLQGMGCRLGQGYLIARPMAPDAATDFIQARERDPGATWRSPVEIAGSPR
jgi:diguanylate cyclase (GGDEF)-like protein